jgi:hypothetical protein
MPSPICCYGVGTNPFQCRPLGFGDPELVGVPRDAMQNTGRTTHNWASPSIRHRDRTVNYVTSYVDAVCARTQGCAVPRPCTDSVHERQP